MTRLSALKSSAAAVAAPSDNEPDTLVPDPVVRHELGDISEMTLYRYDKDPDLGALGWPPKITIRKRNFRSRRLLEAFKHAMMQKAIKERGAKRK